MNLRVNKYLMLLPAIILSLLSPTAKKAEIPTSGKSLVTSHSRLQWDMAEQVRHGFPIVCSPDGLSQDHRDVNHLNLGAVLHFVLLRNCVCHNNSLKGSIIYSGNSWPREDPMGKDSINSGGSS